LYELLAARLNQDAVDLSGLVTYNLDEYLDAAGQWLPPTHALSYRRYMQENFFSRLLPACGFRPANMRFPDAADPAGYDAEIARRGGLDFQLLGLGFNGHIAFNEPVPESRISPEAFAALPTRVVELEPLTRQTNARLTAGGDLGAVPTQAVSMGMRPILAAKEILLLTCFPEQVKPLAALQSGRVTSESPATFLSQHPNLTVVYTTDCMAL
jgi:glucosamine-6-phosphate deaminase